MTHPKAAFNDVSPVEMAAIASLLGDVARASMVSALIDGRARTAGELATAAGVTPQTASSHLAKLAAGSLVTVVPQGRHRYYRLANPETAGALEALAVLAASSARRGRVPGPRDAALREGRTCYDHFAGRLGVAITDALVAAGDLVEDGRSFRVTEGGERRLARLGVEVAELRRGDRPLCRWCLDWSERRPHLVGAVGARLAARCLDAGWVERVGTGRAVRMTRPGGRMLADLLGLDASAA